MRFITLSLLLALPAAQACATVCGGPLATVRINAMGLPGRPQADEATLREYIPLISSSNLEQLRLAAGKLSDSEKALASKARKMLPPFVVHRLPLARLRGVLAEKALLSPRELARRRGMADTPFTPPLEDKLFSGHDCVFATIGPPRGRERYGDVMIVFKPRKRDDAWATHSSGWTFMEDLRRNPPMVEMPVSQDDTLSFSFLLFTRKDWEQAYPYFIVLHLRKRAAQQLPDLTQGLLAQKDRTAFWQFLDDNRLGYFEGKYDREVTLDDIDYIEVPAAAYDEVLSWPETPKGKIRKGA